MYCCPSEGCKFEAPIKRAVSSHLATCTFRNLAIANVLQKRILEDAAEAEARKRARTEVNDLEDHQMEPLPRSPSPPPVTRLRSGRRPRAPKRLVDYLPTTKEDLPSHLANAFPDPTPQPPSRYVSPTVEDTEDEEDVFRTEPNSFGVYREYSVPLQRDPEAHTTLSSVCDSPTLDKGADHLADNPDLKYRPLFWLTRDSDKHSDKNSGIGPFANKSQFRLYDWFYNSSLTKSMADFDDLLDVLNSEGFSSEDLNDFSAHSAQKLIDEYEHPKGVFSAKDGWKEGSVEISLPKTRARYSSEAAAPTFVVGGIHYRSLVGMVRSAAEDSRFAQQYHWAPHELFWLPPKQPGSAGPSIDSSTPIRVITDIYNSDRMLREYRAICAKPRNPTDGPEVEIAIAAILLWSDATHLTSFGSASLWPIYGYLGNLSKYVRGMPTEFAAHHLAYIPSLPDSVKDAYMKVYGKVPSTDVLTFCKRELMQKIWLLLLDDEFTEAYEHGIKVTCGDGVVRRIFPRIFTYSADYPEKILLAALKPLSNHPCPRCLIHHDDICDAGTPEDAVRRAEVRTDTPRLRRDIAYARKLVFQKGVALSSKKLRKRLDWGSLIPTQSAFSTRLARFGVNFYELFVPDLMHEFELGVWKGTFLHLLRLLAAQGEDATQEFNRRMRNMPTFGRDKIRKFWSDVTARKQLAARDYEDFLICMMPAFEGLLPVGDNETVLDLLFELANWHALAKLRLHTAVTIDIFRNATTHMTEAVRAFSDTTCERYETHELPKETEARVRREEQKTDGPAPNRERKVLRYRVPYTVKYHFLPDYPDTIMEIGTTDNGNTQVGELEHRHVKRFYARTNKIRYALQIAKHQRRSALLRALRQHDDYTPRRQRLREAKRARAERPADALPAEVAGGHDADERDDTPLPLTHPADHYAISDSRRLPIRLRNWLGHHDGDPAVANFIPQLRKHLLSRMLDPAEDSEQYSTAQLDGIEIENDRLYRHKVLRVNYTTYDMRRDQDTINPRTHADVMMLSEDCDPHPFLYARVIDIYHARVRYTGPGATLSMRKYQQMEFLRVRWFELDEECSSGFQERRLPRLRFVDDSNPDYPRFGFVDPTDVLRAAYIIPAFNYGTTDELLPPSQLARRATDHDEDYEYYYSCIFADRDLYMRYLGGGIGHRENGVDVEMSKQHALRWRRAGGYTYEPDASRATSQEPVSDAEDDPEDARSSGIQTPLVCGDNASPEEDDRSARGHARHKNASARASSSGTRHPTSTRKRKARDRQSVVRNTRHLRSAVAVHALNTVEDELDDEVHEDDFDEDDYAEEDEDAGDEDYAEEDEYAGEGDYAEEDEYGGADDEALAALGTPGGEDGGEDAGEYEYDVDWCDDDVFAAEGFAPL